MDQQQITTSEPELRVKRTISLSLPAELIDAIDRIARRDDLTRSWIFEKVVAGWLLDQAEGF